MSTLKSSAEDLTLNADGSGNDVIIQSDGSTKAIVTAEGNVGIGVTPESGWHSSLSTLQFGGLGSLHAPSSTGAGNDINLVQNGYTDGSWKHQINDESSLYRQANGTHEFKVAASGAADAAITFTTPLSIANGGDVTVGTGNLVIGTAGKGIDFSATSDAGGMTSELLDDYEEGTWTATFTGATISPANSVGYYTKIGREVFFQYYSGAATISSATGGARIYGLPFDSSSATYAFSLFLYQHGTAVDGGSTGGYVQDGAAYLRFTDTNGTAAASYVDGTKYMMVSGRYIAA